MNFKDIPNKLLDQIVAFSGELSLAQAEKVYSLLAYQNGDDWDYLQLALRSNLPPDYHLHIKNLMEIWRQDCPELVPQAVAVGLLSTVKFNVQAKKQNKIELVWTGPESQIIPLRRTDQLLIELIQQTVQSLWIVSFAVYNIEEIISAIHDAIDRGVRVNIILETEQESGGRLSFDILPTLKRRLGEKVAFFVWPDNKRPRSGNGATGIMHAKIAVFDSKVLLISSANITENALRLNMEMGLLITGNETPIKVEKLLIDLISRGELENV